MAAHYRKNGIKFRVPASGYGRTYQEKLLSVMSEEELPNNATYGDGTPITTEKLDAVRRAYRETEVAYPGNAVIYWYWTMRWSHTATNPSTGHAGFWS